LIAADSNGKSDPFAVVYTKSGSSGKDKSIKTKKISETLNPTWNETFNLILRDRKDSVVIEVWDDDLFGKDHLGTAEIPLEGLEHDKETALVAKLNKQGEVSVAITVRYNDKELEEL
jgi:Ca2+-dependent lipid-binding protein